MLIPNRDTGPLDLQASIEVGLEHLEILESQGSFMENLMSPAQDLFWEYPGHHEYPTCIGWHPLGTAWLPAPYTTHKNVVYIK